MGSSNLNATPLGEIVSFSSGGTPNKKNPNFWVGDIPWISAKEMHGDFVSESSLHISREGLLAGSKLAPEGSLLLLTRGSGLFNGIPLCYVERELAFNQDVKCLQSKDCSVSSKYIFYALKGMERQISGMLETTGIGAGKLATDRLLELEIPLFDAETRNKYVAVAEALFSKMQLNNRLNDYLLDFAMALYVEYLEWPEDALPVGWTYRPLSDFFPVKTGKKDANIATVKGSYPFFTCSQKTLLADNYSFDGSAILVAGNGDFNVKWYEGKFEAYQRTYVLMPENPELLGFLYCAVKRNLNQITSGSRGSVIKFITKRSIADYAIAVPPDRESNDIVAKLNQLLKTIDAIKRESAALEELRSALLPKLMSGEIDVTKMEI